MKLYEYFLPLVLFGSLQINSTKEQSKKKLLKNNTPTAITAHILQQHTSSGSVNYSIYEIDVDIVVLKNNKTGRVLDHVKFLHQPGVFNSITRKITLGEKSTRYHDFHIYAHNIKLIEARVHNECLDSDTTEGNSNDVCITTTFESILLEQEETIEILYEYTIENILTIKEKSFSNEEKEEYMNVIYENENTSGLMTKMSMMIQFEDNINLTHLLIYPEKYAKKGFNSITWNGIQLKPNSSINFSLTLPYKSDQLPEKKNTLLILPSLSTVMAIFQWSSASIVIILLALYVQNSDSRNKSNKNYINDDITPKKQSIRE